MRLHFPNNEHTDVFWAEGRLTVGRGPDQRVVLAHPALAEAHLCFECDPVRGIELLVANGADVHLNSRPVREKALVRLGDMLLIGPIHAIIKADSDEREAPPEPFDDGVAPGIRNLSARVSLRAVAGQYFGKSIGLRARNVVGRGSECDLILDEPNMARQHACIESTGRGVYLRDLGSQNGTLLNGIAVRDAVLKAGDQLAFEQNRFVIEAVGASPSEYITQPGEVQSGITTQVGMKLIPPPPELVAPEETSELPYWTRLLGNMLMMLAAIGALGGIVWAVLRHLGKL
jgi:FHA domain